MISWRASNPADTSRRRCGGTTSQGGGNKRLLGIPKLEDKVAQRAILLLLEPIYEADFQPCSYGFRPGQSARDALRALRDGFMEQGLRWVVDVDISKYMSRNGKNVVRQITAKDRYARALAAVTEWCRQNLHRPFREQHAHLTRMLRGHCAYYGITGNGRRIRWHYHQVVRIWKKWLGRRGRHSHLPWSRFRAMLAKYPLPPALIVHHYAVSRAKLAREEPQVGNPLVRVCEGRGWQHPRPARQNASVAGLPARFGSARLR